MDDNCDGQIDEGLELLQVEGSFTFGSVEQGLRTSDSVIASNLAGLPVTFNAVLLGPDAAFFGISVDSITNVVPARSYTVNPENPCDQIYTSNSGEAEVAVVFHADEEPREDQPYTAQLVIIPAPGHLQPIIRTLSATIIPPTPIDVGLILDRSGSMSELSGQLPKNEATIQGSSLLIQMLRVDIGNRIAVVAYNTAPEVVVPIREVFSEQDKQEIIDLTVAGLAEPQGWTSIAGGVIEGLRELATERATEPPEVTKVLVVLTDGKDNAPYRNPDDDRLYSLLGDQLQLLNTAISIPTNRVPVPPDIKVYSIALGSDENVNSAGLQDFSDDTGAFMGLVNNDLEGVHFFDLAKFFTTIYMASQDFSLAVDPVYTILPGQNIRTDFDVLQGDTGALVVVYDHEDQRLPFYLLTPQDEVITSDAVPSGFQIRSGLSDIARFVELEFPLDEPHRYAGRWGLLVSHEGAVFSGELAGTPVLADIEVNDLRRSSTTNGFVPMQSEVSDDPVEYAVAIGVKSNIRMWTSISSRIVEPREPLLLTAFLSEAGRPLRDGVVIATIETPRGRTRTTRLFDDGQHGDGEENDGEYATWFTDTSESGSYQFTFDAGGLSGDGEPVARQAMLGKYVEGRIPIKPVRGRPTQPVLSPSAHLALWIIVVLLLVIIVVLLYVRAHQP